MKKLGEKVMYAVFLMTACISIISVVLICLFLFANGVPAIQKIGWLNFLCGTQWKPGQDLYGIFPMILGSIYVTAGALVVGVPIGLLCAVFMARFCPKKLHKVLKPVVDLLAGIPSIVYGFFGCDRTVDAADDRSAQRQEHTDSIDHAGNYDSSYDYQRVRGGAASGGQQLL